MAISPIWIDELLAASSLQAAEHLSQFLASDLCDLEDLAVLGSSLAPRNQFALAEMVFAKWTEMTPTNPEPWTNLGLCLSRQKKYTHARHVLEHALRLSPNHLPAMNNLGEVYQQLGEHDLQLKNCLLAVSKYPDSPTAFNNLGTALLEIGMFEEAKHAFETSLILDPDSFLPRFNLAREMSFSGKNSEAIKQLEYLRSAGITKNYRQSEMLDFQLGIDYLTCGRIKEGWQLYEKGFSSVVPATFARSPQRQFTVPMWSGQSLSVREKLMIWREQGVGDEIRFAALLPLLPNEIRSNLILECDPRLVDLFARSMPELEVRPDTQTRNDFDYHLPIGSLARLLMDSVNVLQDAVPLFYPDPNDIERFSDRLSHFKGKKLIGICWRSHKLSATRNKKYTALEDWAGILSMPDMVYVNLQYGECEAELQQMEDQLGIQIQRWDDIDLMNDFSAVAALIKNLDWVISVSSAVVPLAGAVGVPTLCMCHQSWALLGQDRTYPWFPTVTPIVVPHNDAIATALGSVKDMIQTTTD